MPKKLIFTPHSIDADDEDTDICPVCDGQCTCQKQLSQLHPLPSLKIKLTVPKNLLAKHRRVSSNSPVRTTSDTVSHGYLPRKRGRPPKSKTTPSRSRFHPALDCRSRPSSAVGPTKIKQNIRARAALVKRAAAVGRRKKASNLRKNYYDEEDDDLSSLSSITDVDMDRSYLASHFPTFVSASALESIGSSSDSDNDSNDDSSFLRDNLRDREREKARTRKELLGDDPFRRKLGHPVNNEWVIRSRKTSVDLSEAEGAADMDVDSDSDEDDGEKSDSLQNEEEAEDEADPANPDPTTTPLPFLESHDSETTDNLSSSHLKQQQRRRHFVRLDKTGWSFSSSEDEEAGFDARLFFRYLYDSSSSSSSSSGEEEGELTESQDNDDGPLTAHFLCPPKVESLPFELAESWDGGVVFTNGEAGNGDATNGFVDVERLGRGVFGFRGRGDSDTEMDMGVGIGGCASCLEDGYLEEDGDCDGDEDGFSFNEAHDVDEESYSEDDTEEGEGSGDTTDEDLVGSDSLPNERAMRLFKLPLPMWGSVSAVDPLSLVSSRPRRELEMMEVVEGAGEKRRRGKGKNKGKGRMRRETREKGEKTGRERRKEGKKRRESLPNPFDILEGKGTFWDIDEGMEVSEEEDENTSCFSSSSNSLRRALRSPQTPTPMPPLSPTTPVPTTPALSTTTSLSTGPRKGVFVVPPAVSEWLESRKRKGKSREKAMVIIGEDKRGGYVPSPHPRKRSGRSVGGGGDGDVVEQLLRRHLIETLGAPSITNIAGDATAIVKASPPPTPCLGAPFSPNLDDVFSSSSPMMRPIQLDDVLDANFFRDGDGKSDGEDEKAQEVKGDSTLNDEGLEAGMSTDSATTPNAASIGAFSIQDLQGSSTPSLIPSQTDLVADAAAVKNLSRWDVVSVGAFRQTQHQVQQEGGSESSHRHHFRVGHEPLAHGRIRTPGSSTDYGNAMKKSGKFALGVLWRGSGGTRSGGKSAVTNSPGNVQAGAMRRTASGGMIGSKQAKKRRLMMNSSSTSVMKEPLVLPVTSIGAAGGSSMASSSTATGSSQSNTPNKTRKETRRERKLQKRNASQLYGPPHPPHPHSHQSNHQHMYHTHHHHPNAKTRGMGSAQRLGGWFVGGGSGNSGGSGGGAGTWSGSSGFGGGFGSLGP